jgi:hypothetical protein
MLILKAGLLYFGIVFGAGFMLGTIRVLWIVPRFGERTAELIEAPFMFTVIILAARWLVRHLPLAPRPATRLAVGFTGLGIMIFVEFTVVLWLRGITIGEYYESRDPVAGIVYLVMLALFALMPWLVRPETPGIRS